MHPFERPSRELTGRLRAGGALVVLTGAGISAESDLDTFRGAGGIWEGRSALEVATPEAFDADPLAVWRFYARRRKDAAAAKPNAGHLSLAEIEAARPDVLVVTQNVDGLHQRAGTKRWIELHGSLWRLRCVRCRKEWSDTRADLGTLPPKCACGGLVRPGVVWFGESLPTAAFAAAEEAARRASVFLVVGTSALVRPAADLAEIAQASGSWLVEVNPEETNLSAAADERLVGPAGRILPRLAEALRASAGDVA